MYVLLVVTSSKWTVVVNWWKIISQNIFWKGSSEPAYKQEVFVCFDFGFEI
jgi:hypothetical protein